jgi:methylmalonyl-CoA/ethylmalonyl-CoA epimerase
MKLTLHHIGVVVADIPRVADAYVNVLGYQPCTEIIHDPRQLVFVQFFRLPGQAMYIELVAPDRANSKVSTALAKGGGLNHICYATDDIEATCEALRSRRFFQLQQPVEAVAFGGRRIAWFVGPDRSPLELVERVRGAL